MPLRGVLFIILVCLVLLQVCVVTYFYIRPTPLESQIQSTTVSFQSRMLEPPSKTTNASNSSTTIHDYDVLPNTHKLLQELLHSSISQESLSDKHSHSAINNQKSQNLFPVKRSVSSESIQASKQQLSDNHSNSTINDHSVLSDKHLVRGQTWPKDSFCYNFLVNTFHESLDVCSNETHPDSHSIKCSGNPDSEHMATCTFRNLVIRPSLFAKAMFDAVNTDFVNPHDVRLLNDTDTACVNPRAYELQRKMEYGDYVLTLTQRVASNQQSSSKVCQRWVKHTVFFFTAHGYHIYFRFLDYYNLHKSILDSNEKPGDYEVIRISEGENYLFSDFDSKLFSNFTILKDLKDVNTCFRKVILVPKCYASVFFQCKMQYNIQDYCYECDGKGLKGTPFSSFQSRVLNACGIDAHRKEQEKLVLISRKPYIRSNDSFDKFQRILENEDELVNAIRNSLPTVNVTDLQFENLHICDQIRHVRNSHVLMGVHGAGLVHSWWLRDDALAFELEPFYQIGNPSFRMLTTLTGRNYHSVSIDGGYEFVSADIGLVSKINYAYLAI